jgi:hypothetical protein
MPWFEDGKVGKSKTLALPTLAALLHGSQVYLDFGDSWTPLTSGLLRLIGGCTLYRRGRPRISLRPLSSPSVPHHLYRGAEIGGPKF